jgi:CheY-like chemotaxis protein
MAGRVLVLETDEAQVDQLDRLLGSRGLEVEALSSGEQGVARAEQRPPVLVVSALELPDAQGFGLCRRLKRHPVLKDVPLFLLGRASERAAMEEHSRLRGRAEGYFVKPFSGEAFWAYASRWIEQGASGGAPAAWVERGARVLLVDAQRGALEPLKAALEWGGCEVEVAEGGAPAWASVQARRPELVVVSAELPDLSGFSLCRRMRRHPSLRDVPVFLTSERASPALLQEHNQLRSGADAYFLKPLQPQDVLREVGNFLPLGG